MELIAELRSAAAAQTFADYCLSQGLQVSVVVIGPQQAALYAETADAERVATELAAFASNPDAAQYNAAAWQLGQPNRQVSGDAAMAGLWFRVRQQTGPVTLLLVSAALLIYLAMQIWPQPVFNLLRFQQLQSWFSLNWLTPALLHFSSAHLMFNILALLIYGGRLERQAGSVRFLLLVVVMALCSNLAQAWVSGPYFGGLSGVVYGIFGYVWLYGVRFPNQPLLLSKADLGLALGFMALGFADLLWVNTANWAHLAGFVSGLMLAAVASKHR